MSSRDRGNRGEHDHCGGRHQRFSSKETAFELLFRIPPSGDRRAEFRICFREASAPGHQRHRGRNGYHHQIEQCGALAISRPNRRRLVAQRCLEGSPFLATCAPPAVLEVHLAELAVAKRGFGFHPRPQSRVWCSPPAWRTRSPWTSPACTAPHTCPQRPSRCDRGQLHSQAQRQCDTDACALPCSRCWCSWPHVEVEASRPRTHLRRVRGPWRSRVRSTFLVGVDVDLETCRDGLRSRRPSTPTILEVVQALIEAGAGGVDIQNNYRARIRVPGDRRKRQRTILRAVARSIPI